MQTEKTYSKTYVAWVVSKIIYLVISLTTPPAHFHRGFHSMGLILWYPFHTDCSPPTQTPYEHKRWTNKCYTLRLNPCSIFEIIIARVLLVNYPIPCTVNMIDVLLDYNVDCQITLSLFQFSEYPSETQFCYGRGGSNSSQLKFVVSVNVRAVITGK